MTNKNDLDWLDVVTKVVMILAFTYFTIGIFWSMAKGWF